MKLICVECRAFLQEEAAVLTCTGCGEAYPVQAGIADVRPLAMRARFDEQAAVTEALLAAYDTSDFATLLTLFFRVRDVAVPQQLLTHYRHYMSTTLARGQKFATMFLQAFEQQFGALPQAETVVDIGCGSGAMMLALSRRFTHVVGIDPKRPRLILAKKLLEENGVHNFRLFQGYGQHVPVVAGAADFVTAQNVMEHVFDVDSVVGEVHRLLRDGGGFAADSRNRYDLFFKEPHVQIRWVGFMPRAWGKKYVAWRTGTVYDSAQLLSLWDCQRVLAQQFGQQYALTFPDVQAYGQAAQRNRLLAQVEKVPFLKTAALTIFPTHLLIAQKST